MINKLKYILFLLACNMLSIVKADTYVPNGNDPSHNIGAHTVTTQPAFQSSSYYNGSYTVPFAADEIEVGANNPYRSSSMSGPQQAPPWMPGGEGNNPDYPSVGPETPIGDGIWMMLLCALVYVGIRVYKRRKTA